MIPTVQVCQDFIQGDAFTLKLSHNPVPNEGPASALGIEGTTFELTLKKKESGSSIMSITYVVPAGTDATAGIAHIPITTADTEGIMPGEYYGSLKRTFLVGEPRTIIRTGKSNARKVIVYKNLKNV